MIRCICVVQILPPHLGKSENIPSCTLLHQLTNKCLTIKSKLTIICMSGRESFQRVARFWKAAPKAIPSFKKG